MGIQKANAKSTFDTVIPHAHVILPSLSLKTPTKGRPSAVPVLRIAMMLPVL